MTHPRLEKTAAVCVFVLVTIFATGYMATHAADYWKMKRERFSATAGATLTSGNLVCLDSTGNAQLADANDAARRPALGVIAVGGNTGSTVEIVTNGIWMSDSTTVGAGTAITYAAMGASIGYAVGGFVDPPDMPQLGQGELEELRISTVQEGEPVPIVYGTTKIGSAKILWYGHERNKEVKESQGGKGGGGGEVTTGVNYYLSWALGICLGPVDVIYAIFKDDICVWNGEEWRPENGGYSIITPLEGMDGGCRIYWGTTNHVMTDMKPGLGIADALEDPTLNVPYRHLCWCFMDNRLIGQFNRAPSMKFMIGRFPANPSLHPRARIGKYNYNPAHALWRVLTDAAGMPTAWLDATSFATAAETLRLEGRGISLNINSTAAAQSYVEKLLNHMNAVFYHHSDGTWHLDLIRDDYEVASLPSVDETDLLEPPVLTRATWIGTINDARVQFTEIFVREETFEEDSPCIAEENIVLSLDAETENRAVETTVRGSADGGATLKVEKLGLSAAPTTVYFNGAEVAVTGYDDANDETDSLTLSAALSEAEVGDTVVVVTTAESLLENGERVFHFTGDDCGPYKLQRKTDEGAWFEVGFVDKNFSYESPAGICVQEAVRVVNAAGVTSNEVEIGGAVEGTLALDDDFIMADSDDSVTISWTGGAGPFTASVSGTGYEFAFSETDIRQNTLHMGCGTGEFTITDACGEEVTGMAFSNDGAWLHVSYQYAKYAYGIRTCCWCTTSGGSTGCWKLQSRFHGSQDCNVPYYYFSDCMDHLSDYGENPCDKSTPTYYCGTYCGCPPDDSDPCGNPGGFGKSWEQMLCVWGCADAGSHCPDSPTITDCPTRAGFG